MADDTQPSKYVTLVSNDNFEFVVLRECANQSGTLKRMLGQGSTFSESLSGRCTFDEIAGVVLERIVEYLYYSYKHANNGAPPSMDVPPELCLELLVAADYLSL